jgi:DNA-binding NarL/FixJ family response regulator
MHSAQRLVSCLMQKLSLHNTAEIVRYAVRKGLIV